MEIAGSDSDEIARKRLLMLANKYNRSMLEPRLLLQHTYDKLYYLVSQELTTRTDTVERGQVVAVTAVRRDEVAGRCQSH